MSNLTMAHDVAYPLKLTSKSRNGLLNNVRPIVASWTLETTWKRSTSDRGTSMKRRSSKKQTKKPPRSTRKSKTLTTERTTFNLKHCLKRLPAQRRTKSCLSPRLPISSRSSMPRHTKTTLSTFKKLYKRMRRPRRRFIKLLKNRSFYGERKTMS